jgi:hypothetical protein
MKSFNRIKKINGIEYIYEVTPYYDKETKKIKQPLTGVNILAKTITEAQSKCGKNYP